MFPIPFNFPFKKSDGSLSTIGAEISAGGGGGGYTLPTASASTKGGVKIGSGLTMTGEVLSNDNPTPYSLPIAAANVLGGVKVGTNLSIDENGVLSASGGGGDPYVLPPATASTLGGIKVGSGLSVTQDGTLSTSGGGGGGSVYTHCLKLEKSGTFTIYAIIVNSSATPLTISSLISYLGNDKQYYLCSNSKIGDADATYIKADPSRNWLYVDTHAYSDAQVTVTDTVF